MCCSVKRCPKQWALHSCRTKSLNLNALSILSRSPGMLDCMIQVGEVVEVELEQAKLVLAAAHTHQRSLKSPVNAASSTPVLSCTRFL